MTAPLTDEELHQYRDDLEHGTLSYQQQLGLLRGYAELKRILDTRTLVMPGQCTEEERRILRVMARQDEMMLQMAAERDDEEGGEDPYQMLCVHELARREAERAKLEPPPEKPATQIIDLFEALKKSLQEAERAKGGS